LEGFALMKRLLNLFFKETVCDDIKTGIQEIGCDVVDWLHLAQDTDRSWGLVKTLLKLRVL
jgi:hypothetical protein